MPITSLTYVALQSLQSRVHPPFKGLTKSATVLFTCALALSPRSSIDWSPNTIFVSSSTQLSTAAWNSLSRSKRMGEPFGWKDTVFAHRVGHVSSTNAARVSFLARLATVVDASSIEAGL
jgi:hypothetical protein